MKLYIFSIFDSKVEAHLPPFTAPTEAAGIRMFKQAAQDPTSNFHLFAGDYTLMHIGSMDDHTGVLTPLEQHINLGTALMHAYETPQEHSFPGTPIAERKEA